MRNRKQDEEERQKHFTVLMKTLLKALTMELSYEPRLIQHGDLGVQKCRQIGELFT